MRKVSRMLLLIVAFALLATAGVLIYRAYFSPEIDKLNSSVIYAGQQAPSATGEPPPECSTDWSVMQSPTSMYFDRTQETVPVVPVGADASGAAGTPPNDRSHTMAWFNQSPPIGSAQGKSVLTAHTYVAGDGLGNALMNPDRGLHTGDVIRVSDDTGRTLCYQYQHGLHINVSDYDPTSSVVYDDEGDPMLAIVVCADFVRAQRAHVSRVIFYATPMVSTSS